MRTRFAVLVLAASLVATARVGAQPKAPDQTAPLDLVKATVSRVLAIVQAPRVIANDGRQRRAEIRRAAQGLFDFREMARLTLAQHWKDRSAPEQEEFVQLFTELLERSYLTTIENYAGEKITFVGETISGPYAFELVQGSKVLSAAATHHVLTIQPGGAAIAARNNEYLLNSPIPIDYQRSQTSITLPAPGTLAVFATNETCSIAVDGVDLGNPPIPRKPIAPGPHTVSLKCPDGRQDGQKIRVGAGERAQVTFSK